MFLDLQLLAFLLFLMIFLGQVKLSKGQNEPQGKDRAPQGLEQGKINNFLLSISKVWGGGVVILDKQTRESATLALKAVDSLPQHKPLRQIQAQQPKLTKSLFSYLSSSLSGGFGLSSHSSLQLLWKANILYFHAFNLK